jgi:predicted nucleic acid-binding protein
MSRFLDRIVLWWAWRKHRRDVLARERRRRNLKRCRVCGVHWAMPGAGECRWHSGPKLRRPGQ